MSNNRAGIPLVALDIDGTLGDYHSHFLAFAENWFGRKFPDPKDINPGLKLWQFMGIHVDDYRACKLAFRQGGLKRWMPVYEGASALTKEIRELGVDIWICTTRPFNRLDNIDPDTQEWLRRNEILYDALLFGEDKYAELHRQVHLRRQVLAVVDDLPEMVEEARKFRWPVMLRDQPYNAHYEQPGVQRFSTCGEVLLFVQKWLEWFEAGPVARGPMLRGRSYK